MSKGIMCIMEKERVSFEALLKLKKGSILSIYNNGKTPMIELIRDTSRISFGRNKLKSLKWLRFRIELKDDQYKKMMSESIYKDYKYLLVMPYKIDNNIQKDAMKHVVSKCVSYAPAPNIDAFTGNIHPNITDMDFKQGVKQIILCRENGKKYGPKCELLECDNIEYYYNYQVNKTCNKAEKLEEIHEEKRNNIYVPKACYKPSIDNSDDTIDENDFGYKLLNEIWEGLCIDRIDGK